MSDARARTKPDYLTLAVIPVGIALNLSLGALINSLKLPLYLDAVGTIVVTMLVGWRAGIAVGAISFVLASILISPAYMYFIGTQIAVALYVDFVAANVRAPDRWRLIFVGIVLGAVCACASAPVIAVVFKGATGTGRDFLTAVFESRGYRTFAAVLLSGLISEPLDKTIQLLLAYSLLQASPKKVLNQFPRSLRFQTGA